MRIYVECRLFAVFLVLWSFYDAREDVTHRPVWRLRFGRRLLGMWA